MEGRIKIISEILEYPFALFQEQVCIFEVGLDDNDVLTAFSKKIWDISELNIVTTTYFRGIVFLSIKFLVNDSMFLLTLVTSEKKITSWTDGDWQFFLQKMQACIAILSDTQPVPQKRTNQTSLLANSKQDEKVNQPVTLDLDVDFTDHYQLENHFIQALQKSDILVLNKMVHSLSKINKTTLSKNALLGSKYRFVSLITLITRASINYGCPSTIAYRLSDKLIRKLDNIETRQDFTPLINQMLIEFSILIKTRSISHSQPIVKQATEYIYRNLYEDLSNQVIAEEIKVHPSYLSSAFKKSMGTSLRNFITTAKINEAKYLISNTDLSFKEISESLRFANQSYFCKQFKAETHYTPKEFKVLF